MQGGLKINFLRKMVIHCCLWLVMMLHIYFFGNLRDNSEAIPNVHEQFDKYQSLTCVEALIFRDHGIADGIAEKPI